MTNSMNFKQEPVLLLLQAKRKQKGSTVQQYQGTP